MGEFGATQDLERERMAQQASQFETTGEQEAARLAQQASQFATTGEQEAARLAQQAKEAVEGRQFEMGMEGSRQDLERERLAQQASQFATTGEQEAARLAQQAGQFETSTQMEQEQSKAERDRLALSMLLGAQDEGQKKMLGYDDKAYAKAETERLMQGLGLRPTPGISGGLGEGGITNSTLSHEEQLRLEEQRKKQAEADALAAEYASPFS